MIRIANRFMLTFAAIAASMAVAAAVFASRADATPARLRCPPHLVSRQSLRGLSRTSRVPVPVLLWFAFECSGYRPGGWTVRMSHYLQTGDFSRKYTGWYWIPSLP